MRAASAGRDNNILFRVTNPRNDQKASRSSGRGMLTKFSQMTPAEFKRKWARYSGKETSAYQEHFYDLCTLLGQPTPATADPTGSESFCFQKRVVKDEELFALAESGRVAEEPEAERERGFADVWKRGLFRLGIQG